MFRIMTLSPPRKSFKKCFKHLNNVAASPMFTLSQQIFTYNIKNCSHLITKLRFISFCHLVVFISNLLNLYIKLYKYCPKCKILLGLIIEKIV